jgi:hypothetical protein
MRTIVPVFVLVALGSATASSIPPFSLDLSGLGGSGVSVTSTTLASGINFPYGMTFGANGSLLFAQSLPTTSNGIEGGPSIGSLWVLPKQADGSFGTPQQAVNNLNGPATNVRSSGGITVIDSGAASGRTMTFYNQANQLIGSLNFNYPTQDWEHSVGMSLIVPESNGVQRIYFIVGSQFDQQKTTLQVTTSGLFSATLNPDSVYFVDVSSNGNAVQAVGAPQQVATGLRNPFGLTLDCAGDLVVGDNGQDGSHSVNEMGADTLNVVPASQIGSVLYDFGFPDSYTDFATGMRVNGDPGATLPLVSFLPISNSMSVLQYSEGLAGMAYVAPGAMPFVGTMGGEFVAFHGTKDAAGAANFDDALLYYDFAAGKYTAIVDGGTAGIGHLDTVLVEGNSLFIEDYSSSGVVDENGGAGTGALYEFSFSTPEPGTAWLMGVAIALVAFKRLSRVNQVSARVVRGVRLRPAIFSIDRD